MPDIRLATDSQTCGTISLERGPQFGVAAVSLRWLTREVRLGRPRRLQLTELVGATLMHGNASRNEVQLQVVEAAVGDVDTILMRNIERQAPAAGCRD